MKMQLSEKPRLWCTFLPFLFFNFKQGFSQDRPKNLAETVAEIQADVLTDEPAEARQRMLYEDGRARLREANLRESRAWRTISSREAWEDYRDSRIEKLRASLGQFPEAPRQPLVKTAPEIDGSGYRIERLVYESRPGLKVTANLYRPEKPTDSMPGIIICHSHHNPKTQGELQDMGILWARAGCLVLVPDQLGHGERRQHPFRSAKDFAGSFRVSRQDYYFRYNVALQLHLAGESLMGWMAWDMMRGVDLLLSRPGIDPKRIILLGAVAGGGDPAAVTAALDTRIAAVVPFNFGGPQPETGTLGADAEDAFNYAGSGSWESTRNLRLSARDGFLPWVIVGAAAPRGLIYAHEFRWDQERDPVWKRLNTIYEFYDQPKRISWVKGHGTVKMSSNQATHCNNIGEVHRVRIHSAFKDWFDIPEPNEDFRKRRPSSELLCLSDSTITHPVFRLADELAARRRAETRRRLNSLPPSQKKAEQRKLWQELLGRVEPYQSKIVNQTSETKAGVRIEKFVLTGDREIRIPTLLLVPNDKAGKPPVVVMIAQAGKSRLLKARSAAIVALLDAGVAVCLPDLRGSGETRPGDGRARRSWATSLSATELMLGQTMIGSRLKDLRTLIETLRKREDFDPDRIAVWGDSLAPVNPPDRNLNVPRGIDNYPDQSEPGGPILALLAGFFDEDLAAIVSARGGLVSFGSLLKSPFFYAPHDAFLPGVLTVGDLDDLAEMMAPRPLWMSGLVNGRNQTISDSAVETVYAKTRMRYQDKNTIHIAGKEHDPAIEITPWLVKILRRRNK